MKKLTTAIIALLLCTQLAAQSELKTKSVSIFKNGKSFVVKEGTVPVAGNTHTLSQIPNALFGTLWFAGLRSDIVQVTSKTEQVKEDVERKALTFTDLLFANKGKQLTLTTGNNQIYTGTVEDFDLSDKTAVLLIKMDGKWLAIDPSTIKMAEFPDKPEQVVKTCRNESKPVIKVQFAKGGDQPLSLMYLQDGISWTPTYLLELVSDTEARLRLQAEVANDSEEDLVNTNINFVVGVPNFKFATGAATLTSFVKRVRREPGLANTDAGYFSNALVAGQVYNGESLTAKPGIDDENNEAEASEDLYFYTIDNVSLENGARAHYPLFDAQVKIKHLYECSLPMQEERNYRMAGSEQQLSFNIRYCNVFHTIKINNDTKNPFTTGPVMIVDKKAQPLAEDLLTYTGAGQNSSIKVTQSPDVRVREQEKIIDTKREAKEQNNYSYDLLTIQSEVIITNSKKQDVEIVVNKTVSGKSKTATVKYDSRQTPGNDSGNINPADNLKFNLKVKAGQSLKFTYTYEMYVRS